MLAFSSSKFIIRSSNFILLEIGRVWLSIDTQRDFVSFKICRSLFLVFFGGAHEEDWVYTCVFLDLSVFNI